MPNTRTLKINSLQMALFALAIIAIGLATVHAQDTGLRIVRVGYYEQKNFEEGASDKALKTGYAYEYYQRLAQYAKWKYEYVYGDWNTLYQMLINGKIDFLAGAAWSQDRVGILGYPKIAMGNTYKGLVKKISDTSINDNPASLSGKRIGLLDSTVLHKNIKEYLDEHKVSAEIVAFATYEQQMEAFANGRVDVLLIEDAGDSVAEGAEVFVTTGDSDYYIITNIRKPDLLDELNEAQRLLFRDTPTIVSQLQEKYNRVNAVSITLSSEELKYVETHDKITVGYINHALPYSDTGKDGAVTGMLRDVLQQMTSHLYGGNKLHLDYVGFDDYMEMLSALNSGKIDTAFPCGGGLYFAEQNGMYLSRPVVTTAMSVVYKDDFDPTSHHKIACYRNNLMQRYYVQSNFNDFEIVFCENLEDCLNKILSGEADCMIINGLRVHFVLKNPKFSNLNVRPFSRSEYCCFGVNIGNQALLAYLNRGLGLIDEDAGLNLSYRYADAFQRYTTMDFLRDNLVAILLLCVFIIAAVVVLLLLSIRVAKRQTEAKLQAEFSNKAKTEFLFNMSHDIRTPMNAILGFANMAKKHISNKEKIEECLSKIQQSGELLLGLINGVLELSRIESGEVSVCEEPHAFSDVFDSFKPAMLSLAASKDIDMKFTIGKIRNQFIYSDGPRLDRILVNIISNAIKYTRGDGRVSVSVEQIEDTKPGYGNYRFIVEDNGIGMSEEFQEHMFEQFAREKNTTVSGIQGTGLGLPLAKKLVEMMGGTISCQSRQGIGTTFTMIFPFRLQETEKTVPKDIQATETPSIDFTGRKALLVEDNELNREIALEILCDEGLAVDEAEDGSKAVELIKANGTDYYDFILMDVQMPVMNGYEATKIIRSLPGGEKLPIIALSANAFAEDKQRSLAAGLNDHVAKPIKIKELLSALAKFL